MNRCMDTMKKAINQAHAPISEPDYYKVSDGRQFREWYYAECAQLLSENLDHCVFHDVASACEHFWRNGFKPGENHDQEKFDYWMRSATDLYVKNNFEWTEEHSKTRFVALIAPVLEKISWERVKKQLDRQAKNVCTEK